MLNNIIKIDLHIHSIASEYKEEKEIVKNSTINNLEVLFNKLQENNIGVFSITDHNRMDPAIYKRAKEIIADGKYPAVRNILTGVEFDVKLENDKDVCHIITIFDTKSESDIDKIHAEIEQNKLIKENEYYTRDRYETLLSKICLSAILIVHQRTSLKHDENTSKSLSGSVENPNEAIKIGYINALEYQSSKVQGILKNELKEMNGKIPLITGSDCHQWECYPKHDASKTKWIERFTTIKALPTFKGLLMAVTSPETRVDRSGNEISDKIDSFDLNGEKYELDSGINVIVGENGSGKSTLFELLANQEPKKYMTAIKKSSDFKCESSARKDNIYHVGQSEIVDAFNGVSSDHLFSLQLFNDIDDSEFEKIYRTYANNLKEYIYSNIEKNDKALVISKTSLVIKPELEVETFYIHVDKSNLTIENHNNETHKDNLLKICKLIHEEIISKEFSTQQTKILKDAFAMIAMLYKEYAEKMYRSENEISLKNSIISVINDYEITVANNSSSMDRDINTYKGNRSAFIKCIVDYISQNMQASTFPENVKKCNGYSQKIDNGFKFVREANYNDSDVMQKFKNKMFVTNYQTTENICSLNTKSDFSKAINTCSKIENIETIWAKNLNDFIKAQEKYNESIIDLNNNTKGATLGQLSLTYYKYKLTSYKNFAVVFIDQPEDNLSNKKINKDLISYFNKIRNTHQLIIVTHNPLLVVNLDVDNVIIMNYANGKISCKSGCLEDEQAGIMDYVANNMDGGKDSIKRRYKLYE